MNRYDTLPTLDQFNAGLPTLDQSPTLDQFNAGLPTLNQSPTLEKLNADLPYSEQFNPKFPNLYQFNSDAWNTYRELEFKPAYKHFAGLPRSMKLANRFNKACELSDGHKHWAGFPVYDENAETDCVYMFSSQMDSWVELDEDDYLSVMLRESEYVESNLDPKNLRLLNCFRETTNLLSVVSNNDDPEFED